MNSREIYIGIRFSRKASERMKEKQLQDFKKNIDKNAIPKLKKEFKKVDKGVKVWSEIA